MCLLSSTGAMTQSVPCSQTPDGFRTGIERGKLEAKGN